MMTSMLLFGLLTCLVTFTRAAEEWKTHLGKGFYLPHIEIGVTLKGGYRIFNSLDDSCFHTTIDRASNNDRSFFDNSREFYKRLAIESSLSIEFNGAFTMGFTLGVKSGHLSQGEVEVTGTSIDIYHHVSTGIIEKDCLAGSRASLSDDLIADLNDLPSVISNPVHPSNVNL